MYKNETFLTPLYRYIIGCIERNGKKELQKTCKEIENFFDIWPATGISHEAMKEVTCRLKDSTIRLLSSETEDERYRIWEQEYEILEQVPCSCCVSCINCRDYYWQELGELLFQRMNSMKQGEIYVPVRNIPARMRNHLMPSRSAAELYSGLFTQSRNKPDDCCIVLKGMSSSTPSLLNGMFDTSQYSGGGFFLRYHSVGIAIDPGYHFLDNMHHYGLSVADISAVVVTHEHIDHNNDMRLLDDLYHAISKYVNKKLQWYLDKASYDIALTYRKYGTGFDEKVAELHCVNPHKGSVTEEESSFFIDLNREIKMDCFSTEHIPKKGDTQNEFQPHTFGCQFTFGMGENIRRLVYTSDTRFFPGLSERFEMPDILIANISSIYEDDLMLVKAKSRHLGYYGCYHLLTDMWNRCGRLPELTTLSEFWNGENDIRYDVAMYLKTQIKQLAGVATRVLPAEIGMVFRIEDCAVMCSQCGRFSTQYRVCRPIGYEEKIKVICDDCCY